jgi:hypothetical protein
LQVARAGGRLIVRWGGVDPLTWHACLQDFKQAFRTHGQRSYSRRARAWSVPRAERHRLAEWALVWFGLEDQEWEDQAQA